MGYYSTTRGYLQISPPLSYDELFPDLMLDSRDAYIYCTVTDTSPYDIVSTQVVTPDEDEPQKRYDLESHIQEIADAYRDHQLTGRIVVYGEEAGDITGYVVRNGVVEVQEPSLKWPGDDE